MYIGNGLCDNISLKSQSLEKIVTAHVGVGNCKFKVSCHGYNMTRSFFIHKGHSTFAFIINDISP